MSGRRVWQIAAGETGRGYADLFLDHDVMFVGPGRYGAYDEGEYAKAAGGSEYTSFKHGMIRRFVQDVQPGDIVLLRRVHEVIAIGLVADVDYSWDERFDDVFGWDLQHSRRVIWQEAVREDLAALQAERELFGDRKQIPMFTEVHEREVLDRVAPLLDRCGPREMKDLPPAPPTPLDTDALGPALFARGLPNDSVDRVLAAIQRQRRMLNWYYAQRDDSGRPNEHEVVAHMILPLLLALGWSEQLLAVDWRRIDLAAFSTTPTTGDTCVLICEAKGLRHGLQGGVLDQAQGYAADIPGCRRILLTNGARLYLYEKRDDRWPAEPVGYVNVEKIRTEHIAPRGTNAVDTLVALTPTGIGRGLAVRS